MSDDEKLHSGYYGWMKTIAKTSQDFTPVRITNAVTDSVTSSDSRSVWNSAGTWEERDKSEWARERLKHHILTSFRGGSDTEQRLSFTATSIVQCDGEAKVVFGRGKKRCGYELSVKFAWERGDVSGHIELLDFDDTSGDEYAVVVTANGGGARELAAKKAVIDMEPELRKLLALWKQELLQQ